MATEDKVKAEVEEIEMEDGRKVGFAGKRQILKEPIMVGNDIGMRFDFRNGQTMSIMASELTEDTLQRLVQHGLAQKCGDEAAGEKKIEDIAAAVEDMMGRLRKGEWRVVKAAGDSFAGTNIVIRAVAEVAGKSIVDVKAFLQEKLDAAKAAGKALSRQELYNSFRKPGTKTATVIGRLEAEEAAGKAAKVSADDLLGELAEA